MLSHSHDMAFIQDINAVAILNGGRPLANQNNGEPPSLFDVFANKQIALIIKSTRGLI